MHTLNFREYDGPCKRADLARLEMEGLTTLCIPGLNEPYGDWPLDLVAKNHKSLRHLQIGSEVDLASEYATGGYTDSDETFRFGETEYLAESMKRKFDDFNDSSLSNRSLRLESLSLIGLDLNVLLTASVEPVLDFSSLGTLTLESCAGLRMAFPLLIGPGAGRAKVESKLRLHTFVMRHENTTDGILLREIQTFLLSLKPLTNLHVLLEGTLFVDIELRKIFKHHGERLRSLIWDEREGPRADLQHDQTYFLDYYDGLKLIAKFCSGLKALGISLDWEKITGSRKTREKVRTIAILQTHKLHANLIQTADSFSKLKQLQTLNIRNLPVNEGTETWLPEEYKLEALGTMLLNIMTKKMTRIDGAPVLKTLALGASTFGNVRMGVSHFTPNSVSTFLQLRIYHVNYDCNYDCRYQNSLSPKLHLIARGTPADAYGNADNLDIFSLYWLDGAPREMRRRLFR